MNTGERSKGTLLDAARVGCLGPLRSLLALIGLIIPTPIGLFIPTPIVLFIPIPQ